MRNFKFFALPFLLGVVFWFVVFLFLPKIPIFYVNFDKGYNFYNINLTKLFFTSRTSSEIKPTTPTYSLKNIKLKAIYNNGKNGFIVIKDKGKTHFVDLNAFYNGYKLIKINPRSAIFNKNGKNYKIEFERMEFKGFKNYANNIESVDYPIKIEKKVFFEYKKNLLKVWQNIGIIKTKNGYKITFVKPKSIFDEIGLKKGDILLEINGRKLKNDQDAWNLYKNADKFDEFEIKIKRNNQTKVLYYEMD